MLSTQDCDNVNKARWNELVDIHMKSSHYRVNDFISGALESSIDPAILKDLAPYINIKGKRVLHLQCHFGQDTLSFLRLGAETVVGVDYSSASIEAASRLAAEMGYSERAKFVCSNVLTLIDCAELRDQKFDLVITNEGVLGWLSDLHEWSHVIKHYLDPVQGVFYVFEFHPFARALDGAEAENLEFAYPYFPTEAPIEHDSPGTYTEQAAPLKNRKDYEWIHPLGEITNFLLHVGLCLKFLHEYSFSTFYQLPGMKRVEGEDRRYIFKDEKKRKAIPLMFSILACVS